MQSTDNPFPVSVVAPIPSLFIPSIGRSPYDGSGILITGFVYPEPPPTIVNSKVPPVEFDEVPTLTVI